MLKHIEEEFLRPEELVVVLTTAALFVQMKNVMRTEKLPQGPRVEELFEGKEPVEVPQEYYTEPEPGPEVFRRRPGRKKSV